MPQPKTVFICQQCGSQQPKWSGQCPACGQWNSLVEELVQEKKGRSGSKQPKLLTQVRSGRHLRISTGSSEFDRVLGGGIVSGSVILVAGEPGIGKSTLLLQLAAKVKGQALYISGEESEDQLKLRADRLGVTASNLLVLAETDVDLITETIKKVKSGRVYPSTAAAKPIIVIIDSIQAMGTTDLSGTPGSVGQVRLCASRLHRVAKDHQTPLFLVGQVTKEGSIAGPRVLEHMVDAVLYLEGDRFQEVRLLRSMKNRFGPTDEVGVFRMADQGLADVTNPSEIFLTDSPDATPGSVVVPTLEGTRPILVEIQALTVPAKMAISRRAATGLKYDRVQFLTAVLQKRVGLPLDRFDVYVNAVGGLRINEPAADLGICLAIYSSVTNKPLFPQTVVFGEVGLLGEIRPITRTKQRVNEATKLGYQHILSPDKAKTLSQAIRLGFRQ